jgi:hypothetical protein
MRLIEKIAERVGWCSPMIILILLCISYLRPFENQTSDPEQINKEVKQVDKKSQTDNEIQSYWSFRD